jgi:hypothetical protein
VIYIMSYFTTAAEALHLALSRDGRGFTAINEGQPVLRSTVGSGRLRDPFIGIGPDGLFHLLATDGWTSQSIIHATSGNLLDWSEQSLLPVMADVPGARNSWAPEFFHDKTTGLYHLIWSSVVDPPGERQQRDWENVGQDNRIWSCSTPDFQTFSSSSLFFDPGHPIIDATVQPLDEGFLMAFKDERGRNALGTEFKTIMLTTFASPGAEFTTPTGPVTPAPVEGPSLYRRGDKWVLIFDRFLEGRYGAVSGENGDWHPETVNFPLGVRHASVLTVRDRLNVLDGRPGAVPAQVR